jgi:ABC-type branched-subunit amino acid transport system substrate-binding protein
MPRYTLGDEDLASLTAYLRRIEEDLDPGISAEALRIGTVLPTAGALADVGIPMRAVLSGWFDALNRRGGIHGRRIDLVVAEYDSDREPGLAAARELLREGRVLALVSGFHPAAEPEIAALLAEAKVPSVGPFSLFGPREEGAGAWDFHPSAGLREQARALARFSLRDPSLGSERLAVLHSADLPHAAAARAAAAEASRPGSPPADLLLLAGPEGAIAARLARGGYRGAIVLAPDAAFDALARELASAGSALPLLASGALSGRIATQVAGRHRGPVFLAFPGAPADESAAAASELARLRAVAGAGARSRASQASAMVDAVVLVEGLKRAGRALSRERLVSSLEALHAFETGLSPPVTFGPDRRVGVLGAYVVEVDPAGRAFRPAGGFIALD